MGKKDKGATKSLMNFELPPVPEALLERKPQRWVKVHFKLITTNALDDFVRVPVTSTLHLVEQLIIEHHGGSISKLQMWKDDIHPRNVLRDLTQTIADVWKLDDGSIPTTAAVPPAEGNPAVPALAGKKKDVPDFNVTIHYDFRPHDSECPLLLRSPRYAVKKEEESKGRR